MKSFLKSRVLPALPWLWRTASWQVWLTWCQRKPPFAGVYQSFDDIAGVVPALHYAGGAARRAALSARPELRDIGHDRSLVTALTILQAESVLDFGGGAGVSFGNILNATSRRDFSYCVVELDQVCEAARPAWAGVPQITFTSTLPPGTFDLVYTSSAIQYVRDPISLLRELARRAGRALLLTRTAIGEKSFVRAQLNQSQPHPTWVLSFADVEQAMRDEGLHLAFRTAGSENWNVDGYDAEHKIANSVDLLFLRGQ